MMRYLYSIAGLRFRVLIDKEIQILERHKPFIAIEKNFDGAFSEKALGIEVREDSSNIKQENGENLKLDGIDATIQIENVSELPPIPDDAIHEQYRYYSPKEDGKTWFIYSMQHPTYAYSYMREDEEDIKIELSPEGFDMLVDSNVLSLLLQTEVLLCRNGGLMMHGCTVETPEGGLIFTGPSGIGKSTQGKLWEKYEHATVLNGDRAGLVKRGEEWYSWGLPFAGSSAIYINRGTPLKAIIVLEQARENSIRKLSLREALTCLYPQTHLHHWSRIFMEKGTANLTELIFSIPVYKLSCKPDADAVELVKSIVFH